VPGRYMVSPGRGAAISVSGNARRIFGWRWLAPVTFLYVRREKLLRSYGEGKTAEMRATRPR
jgi:hypothetical protein